MRAISSFSRRRRGIIVRGASLARSLGVAAFDARRLQNALSLPVSCMRRRARVISPLFETSSLRKSLSRCEESQQKNRFTRTPKKGTWDQVFDRFFHLLEISLMAEDNEQEEARGRELGTTRW